MHCLMLSASNSVFAAIVASLLQYTYLIVLDVIQMSSLNQLCTICIQTNIVYNQQGMKSLIQINYYQSNINIGKMTGLSSHSVQCYIWLVYSRQLSSFISDFD